MNSSTNWSEKLYNGLVMPSGATPKVLSTMINKPNHMEQLSEIVAPQLEVTSSNDWNKRLGVKSKQKFSAHRSLSFLPQE